MRPIRLSASAGGSIENRVSRAIRGRLRRRDQDDAQARHLKRPNQQDIILPGPGTPDIPGACCELSACSGEVDAGSPTRTCANRKQSVLRFTRNEIRSSEHRGRAAGRSASRSPAPAYAHVGELDRAVRRVHCFTKQFSCCAVNRLRRDGAAFAAIAPAPKAAVGDQAREPAITVARYHQR